jgi:hypothetical protein
MEIRCFSPDMKSKVPEGETCAVTAGGAVLWPASRDHMAWTEGEEMQAIIIEGPPERESV